MFFSVLKASEEKFDMIVLESQGPIANRIACWGGVHPFIHSFCDADPFFIEGGMGAKVVG